MKVQMQFEIALRVDDDEDIPTQEEMQTMVDSILADEPGASKVQFRMSTEGRGTRIVTATKPGLS